MEEYINDYTIVEDEIYNLFKETVNCSLCLSILINPVICMKCQKVFCKKCVDDWSKKDDKCPNRCVNPNYQKSIGKNDILSKLKFKCKKCGNKAYYDDIKIHIDSNCTEKIIKQELIEKKKKEKENYTFKPNIIKMEKEDLKKKFKINKVPNGYNQYINRNRKIINLKEEEKSREKEKYIEEEPKKEKIKENLGKEKKIGMFDQELIVPDPKDKKSITEDNLSPKIQNMPIEFDNRREKNNKNIDMDRENTDDMEEDEDSMTEITNEEYVKQLIEAIKQMKEGLEKAKVNFLDLMNNVVQKRKISGRFYEYVTIEDFNEQLKSIKITLSDLKLSCLCSKYCIPNELRLVDKNKINKDIQKFIKGTLKLEEDEENL